MLGAMTVVDSATLFFQPFSDVIKLTANLIYILAWPL